MGIRPATPGTIVTLVAFILLLLASISVPILKSIFFLKATVGVSVDGITAGGDLTFGTWGYCIEGLCSNATLGYDLNDVDQIFGITGIASNVLGSLPKSLIKGLTYALILHPIAAGFAFIAFLFGLLSHIREISLTGWSMLFASFGTFFSFLAFLFDIIAFSIAKSRIESAQKDNVTVAGLQGNVNTGGTLGNGIWMTLAAFLCLLSSGCFFCIGRRVIRNRDGDRRDKRRDDRWASDMLSRSDAIEAEKRRNNNASFPSYVSNGGDARKRDRDRNEQGLPSFPEYGYAGNYQGEEHVPLTSMRDELDTRGGGLAYKDSMEDREEAISGVGYGERRTPQQSPMHNRQPSFPRQAQSPPQRITSPQSLSSPSREPFRSMYEDHSSQQPYVPPVPLPPAPSERQGYPNYQNQGSSATLVSGGNGPAPSYYEGPYGGEVGRDNGMYKSPQTQNSLVPPTNTDGGQYSGFSSTSQATQDPYGYVQPHDYNNQNQSHDRGASGYTDYPPPQLQTQQPRRQSSVADDPYAAIQQHIGGATSPPRRGGF